MEKNERTFGGGRFLVTQENPNDQRELKIKNTGEGDYCVIIHDISGDDRRGYLCGIKIPHGQEIQVMLNTSLCEFIASPTVASCGAAHTERLKVSY